MGIFFALLLSQLLLAVSAEIGYGGSGGYGNPWPDYMHCCKCKSVGYNKYYLVDFLEAEGWKKEGMMLPRRCYDGCIYTMDMDSSGDLYCFARGRQDVMCYDEYLEGYGSGYGYGYGSGYGMEPGYGSEGYGSEFRLDNHEKIQNIQIKINLYFPEHKLARTILRLSSAIKICSLFL